jgi:hypothetical protein
MTTQILTMRPKTRTIFTRGVSFILIASILISCAGSYRPIRPQALTYGSSYESTGIRYSFQHNILTTTGNKKYAKREAKRPVKLVAIELTNNTDHAINFRKDVKIYMGDRQVLPVETSVVHQQLKQPAPLYLLWGLLWVVIYKCDGPNPDDCSTTPLPVGLVIGVGNMAAAGSANDKFLTELNSNNILDKTIAPGETVRGLVGITSDAAGSISLRID